MKLKRCLRYSTVFLITLAAIANFTAGCPADAAEKDPDQPMTRPKEMLAIHHTQIGHSSTFVELEGGRILHFGGSSFTTSDDEASHGPSPSRAKIPTENRWVLDRTLPCKISGKGIGLAARVKEEKQGSNFEWIRSNHMVFWRSEDGGETWQPPVRITPVGVTTASYQDVFLRTSSGRIVLPVFHYLGQRENGWMDVDPPANGVIVRGQWLRPEPAISTPRSARSTFATGR